MTVIQHMHIVKINDLRLCFSLTFNGIAETSLSITLFATTSLSCFFGITTTWASSSSFKNPRNGVFDFQNHLFPALSLSLVPAWVQPQSNATKVFSSSWIPIWKKVQMHLSRVHSCKTWYSNIPYYSFSCIPLKNSHASTFCIHVNQIRYTRNLEKNFNHRRGDDRRGNARVIQHQYTGKWQRQL